MFRKSVWLPYIQTPVWHRNFYTKHLKILQNSEENVSNLEAALQFAKKKSIATGYPHLRFLKSGIRLHLKFLENFQYCE